MLCLTSTILFLVLQTSLTTITALEHFEAIPRDNYALLPRVDHWPLEIQGGVGLDKSMYIEVHPCAHAFRKDLTSRYVTHAHTRFEDCVNTKSSAAWSSPEVGCIPIWTRHWEASALGFCFIFELAGPRLPKAWKHPCEDQFSTVESLWYTPWHTTYAQCTQKQNAEAWQSTASPNSCYVFSGPQSMLPGEVYNTPGLCFILDNVPNFGSYVEVHPCDINFRFEQSALFSVIKNLSTFAECRSHPKAVAWANIGQSNSDCVPIWSEMGHLRLLLGHERGQVRETEGLCFKFNADKSPEPHAVPDSGRISVPYKHACELGFAVERSRWYSRHPKFMTVTDCGKKKNAAAWRLGGSSTGGCFVFYWKSSTENVMPGRLGACYILDKAVPLGSLDPPSWIVTMHHPGHQSS